MNKIKIARYAIPIAIVLLVISVFSDRKQNVEPVEHTQTSCISEICQEYESGAGSICNRYPPRISKIMLVRNSETGSRSIVVKMSDTVCSN